MNPIFKKLLFKSQNPVLVMNAPEEFDRVSDDFGSEIHDKPKGTYAFIMVFIHNLEQLSKSMPKISKAVEGDGVVWICYPKGTSKKYRSDANRDTIFVAVKSSGFTGVSMAAIDDDWSAFRIRKIDFVKK